MHGARRKKFSDSLSCGWLRQAFVTTEGQDAGVLQILGGKPTECGSYFKMSDSESATYQIVGHGSKLNDRLAQEQRFNLIKLTKCYRKGLCLVIEEFESLSKQFISELSKMEP